MLFGLEFLLHDLDVRAFEKVHGVFVGAVGGAVDDLDDARVDECFGAVDAGQVGDVAGGAFGGDAVQRGLDDGVGFGVDGADAMTFDHEVADLVAMILACGGAVEACGEDAFFENEDTANEGAVTGAAFGYGIGDLQEVGIPVWAHDNLTLSSLRGQRFFARSNLQHGAEIASPPKIKNGGSQ